MVRLLDKLIDDKFLMDVKSFISFLFPFVVAILYLGYSGTVTWDALITFKVGALGLITVLSTKVWKKDIINRTFVMTVANHKELTELDTKIADEVKSIKNLEDAADYINSIIDKEQENANLILTKKAIKKINRKIVKLKSNRSKWFKKMRENRIKRLRSKIEKLELSPLFDKKYKPIDTARMIGLKDKGGKVRTTGNNVYFSDPTKRGMTGMIFGFLAKSIGFGGILSIPFVINEDKSYLIAYFGILIASTIYTTINEIFKTTKLTKKSYLLTQRKRYQFLKTMNEHLRAKKNTPDKE